jgi:hypothetical protein
VDDAADREPEEAVDLAHPGGVALGQVIVDRDHMHALAGQRVEVDRQGGDQGFAFAGFHLRDHAAVQHDAADQLDVEVALAQGALGGLAHRGEGLDQEVVQGLALLQAGAEFRGPGAQLLVAQRLELRLQGGDGVDIALQADDVAIIGGAEQALGKRAYHEYLAE